MCLKHRGSRSKCFSFKLQSTQTCLHIVMHLENIIILDIALLRKNATNIMFYKFVN